MPSSSLLLLSTLTSTAARLSSRPSRSVELSPGNSRRIFASTDILADPDTVWDLLTDYDNLAEVVPNLLSNEARRSAERANTRARR